MKHSVVYLSSIVLSLASAHAFADTTPTDSSKVYDIDDVVVIDQPKEAYRLRRQPLSSSSFDVVSLHRLHIEDLRQLSAFVPSFTMPEYGSRYTSAMYVRGIGSRVNSPAVGIYVDNMPVQSKSAFNFHLYDIDRVDVLRGPQGTLYGMNTEGGLIRLYSRNPFNYQGTDLRLSIGTGLWRRAEVSHYAKLCDRAAYSLAAFYDGQNGFFRNAFDDGHADLFNEAGGKGRFIWHPTGRWTFDLMADYQYVRQNGFPYGQAISAAEIAAAPITSPLYSLRPGIQSPNQNHPSTYCRNMLRTGVGIKYAGRGFDINAMTTWQLLRDHMLMDNDYLPQDFMHVVQRQLQNALTGELAIKSRNTGRWHWTFGAVGSYQWARNEAPVSFGKAMDDHLSQIITDHAYNGILNAMATGIADRLTAAGMPPAKAMTAARAAAAAAIAAAGGCHINMEMGVVPGLFHTPTLNAALYHESNVSLTPRITATLGLRYDYSHVAIDYATSARVRMREDVMGVRLSPTITDALAHHEADHDAQLLPKVALTYSLGQPGNIYLAWSKGYRTGGYNYQMFSDILQTDIRRAANKIMTDRDIPHAPSDYDRIRTTIAYHPESSHNIEAGSHLNLRQGRLRVDLALYYLRIRNQQLSVMAANYGFGRVMTNAGRSHSLGLEAALRGSAADNHLTYAANYGFTRAVFDTYTDTTPSGTVDYRHKSVPFIPRHTLSALTDYRFDIDPSALLNPHHPLHLRSIVVGLNLSAQGKTYWDARNTLRQTLYTTLGAHADADCGRLHVSLWGRNISDTKYTVFAVQSSASGTPLTFGQLGNPFQVGVDINYHF